LVDFSIFYVAEEPFPEGKVICTYVDLDSSKIFKLMVCGAAGHSLEKSFYDQESLVAEIEEITGTISKDTLLSRGYVPGE